MADESIIVDLKSQGLDKLIQDLSLSAKGFTELDKSIAESQKKLDTLDKSSQEFKDLTKEINAATIASKAYAESNDTLKKELRDTTNEIGNLERSIKALEKAGQTNTQTYKNLTSQQDTLRKKAGELKDTIGDLNAEIKNSGSDTRNLDKAVRAISTVASGYQVAQGALALYSGENKKFEQALLKLNAVMAITQGLQQIQEELSKRDSVFTQAAAKAKLLYASAIGTSTGALRLFKIALAATGIGLAIVAIGALIANWDKLKVAIFGSTQSLEDFKKKQDEIRESNKKSFDDYETELKYLVNIKEITQETADLKLSIKRRESEEALKDVYEENRKKLDEYQTAIRNVTFAKEDGLTLAELEAVRAQQKYIPTQKELSEQIKITTQAELDYKKAVNDRFQAENKNIKGTKLKELKDETDNLFKLRKLQREAEARHQAQLDELDRKERERLQSTADFRKLKSAEYIAELEAQDQREKAIREKSDDERKVKEDAFRTARAERENADRERRLQAEQEHIEKIGNLIGGLTDVANRIGNLASQAIEVRSQNEIRALDQRKQQGLISEKQYQKEMAKIKNEAARKQRTADIAMAFAMIPQAAFSAFTSTPGGIVVKSIAAALASAFGLAQVALIASAPLPQFRDGGQVSKKLGLIKGARHERGGVPIEVEGDEYVMPVEQTKENLPALEAMHKGTFHKLFVPVSTALQPDIFSNIPNPSNIALPVANEMNDYSSINKRLDKLASEMWWLGQYTKEGNKVRERGTEKIVKNLETQRKRYV
jgi:DNA repair exonuclease SbcCD ATPase subunit